MIYQISIYRCPNTALSIAVEREMCVVELQVVDMVEMVTEAVVDMVVQVVAAGARVVVHMAMDMVLVCVNVLSMMYSGEQPVCHLSH